MPAPLAPRSRSTSSSGANDGIDGGENTVEAREESTNLQLAGRRVGYGYVKMVPERWEAGLTATVLETEVRGVRRGNGTSDEASIDLYWLPLGAGGRSVRLNGRVFEAVQARLERRRPLDLYHSALEVRVPEGRFVIEMTPIPDADGGSRGVVGEGPVGSRRTARFRVLRYELRCWRDGVIPDADEAVASPQRLSDDPARRVASSTSLDPCRHRSGAAMSSGRARCGIRTP